MSIALNSVGTNLNRVLDSLGYQDKFGDALESIADLGTGNIAGAFRNLVDLKSGLTTGQMDSILSGAGRPRFARAYAPRCGCGNAHLDGFRNTYAVREQVSRIPTGPTVPSCFWVPPVWARPSCARLWQNFCSIPKRPWCG